MQQEHFLLNEVARETGQKPYQITYLLTIGVIPEPSLRISNKRVFSRKDISTKHCFQNMLRLISRSSPRIWIR